MLRLWPHLHRSCHLLSVGSASGSGYFGTIFVFRAEPNRTAVLCLVGGKFASYIPNMQFDNSPTPSPSTWQSVKEHLPILLIVGGLAALFISLHTAALGIVALAGLHIVFGLAVLTARHLRNGRTGQAASQS